jgi:hypothetical protein
VNLIGGFDMADAAGASHFTYLHSFPDPLTALNFALVPLEKCLAEGLIVLDANVLLLPFKTGPHALDEIEKAFENLKKQNRLFVPKHALREYLANRPNKIKEFYDQLTKKRDKDYSTPATSRIAERSTFYPQLVEAEKQLKDQATKLSRLVGSVIDEVRQWQTNDPVSQVYKRLLSPEIIIGEPDDRSVLEKEHQERLSKSIPPGYKDGGKEKNNIGDFLIWKSILSLGEKNNGKHVVFVSGDEKADWVYRSAGETLYARSELIEEYRKVSKGGSFHLVDLAALLRHLKASDTVVAEVRFNEASSNENPVGTEISRQTDLPWSDFSALSEVAVGNWLGELFGEDKIGHVLDDPSVDYVASDNEIDCFVKVRAIRNYEYFKNRVAEIIKRLEPTVKGGASRDKSKSMMGMVVFACENIDGAYFISQAVKNMIVPPWLAIQSGYLKDQKFVAMD